MSSDTIRPNPINADLLLVSAYYLRHHRRALGFSGAKLHFFLYEVLSKRRAPPSAPPIVPTRCECPATACNLLHARVPGKVPLSTWSIFWIPAISTLSTRVFLRIGK